MSRVWVYDRSKSKKYKTLVERAKAKRQKPPSRWLVMYYDRTGQQRSESAPTKERAQSRRTELEASLEAGTYVDPAMAKVKLGEMAEKWLERAQYPRPRHHGDEPSDEPPHAIRVIMTTDWRTSGSGPPPADQQC